MRILVVTNLYPPHYQGGYEVRCAQVAEALRSSGHDVCVLTSTHGLPLSRWGGLQRRTDVVNGIPVHRRLSQGVYPPQPPHRPWTLFQAFRELADLKEFTHLVETFRPDIINWWSMWGLSKTLLPLPPVWGIPDVHWVEHYWMIEDYGRGSVDPSLFWTRLWDGEWGPRALRPLLRLTGRWWERRTARRGWPTRAFPNCPRHVCFVSEHLRALHRAAGLEFPASEVIHGGVPPEAFYEAAAARRRDPARLRVLYAGQITRDRGLHTVIEALGLVDPHLRDQVALSIVGTGPAQYLEHIKTRVEELRLGNCMTFHGKMPHEQMPRIYKSHDVLVFPSIRDEGLPLTMVEAMLAGCAVVTTGSGGAMEVATAAELPLFEKEDAVALSRILSRFVNRPDEVARVAARGQRSALSDFSFDHMMRRWLATLQRLHHTALHGHPAPATGATAWPARRASERR
jgi:glycogen synthase